MIAKGRASKQRAKAAVLPPKLVLLGTSLLQGVPICLYRVKIQNATGKFGTLAGWEVRILKICVDSWFAALWFAVRSWCSPEVDLFSRDDR